MENDIQSEHTSESYASWNSDWYSLDGSDSEADDWENRDDNPIRKSEAMQLRIYHDECRNLKTPFLTSVVDYLGGVDPYFDFRIMHRFLDATQCCCNCHRVCDLVLCQIIYRNTEHIPVAFTHRWPVQTMPHCILCLSKYVMQTRYALTKKIKTATIVIQRWWQACQYAPPCPLMPQGGRKYRIAFCTATQSFALTHPNHKSSIQLEHRVCK